MSCKHVYTKVGYQEQWSFRLIPLRKIRCATCKYEIVTLHSEDMQKTWKDWYWETMIISLWFRLMIMLHVWIKKG